MRVGEAAALEVGHGIGLAPHHIVEDPEAQVLQDGADAEDVVIGADHPDRAIVAQHMARRAQPVAGELVIGRKAAELVPVIVHRIDLGLVGAVQLTLELHVVGRVGEHQVGAAGGQGAHALHAVALDDLIQLQRTHVPAQKLSTAGSH
jgi:hypothetical protein